MSFQGITENIFQSIWNSKKLKTDIITKERKSIKIIDFGKRNNDLAGPDFLNAKLKIDDVIYSGDIEIDIRHENWKLHNHYKNKKYNNVILHIVIQTNTNQKFVITENSRKIISIPFKDLLHFALRESISSILNSINDKNIQMPCAGKSGKVIPKVKEEFLIKLGVDRFFEKQKKMLQRIKELSFITTNELKEPIIIYDLENKIKDLDFDHLDFKNPLLWEQLLFENVFTALGYSKNKTMMFELAKSVEIRNLKNIENINNNLEIILESILFNVSGLLPDVYELPDEETTVYTRELAEIWQKFRNKDYGKKLQAAEWNFFRMRPQNFPTIRIAGGVKILIKILKENLIYKMIKSIEDYSDENITINELRSNFIIKATGYWQEHFVFDKPTEVKLNYLIGKSRADEIMINIILPFLSLYFRMFGKELLNKKLFKIYLNYKQTNNIKIVQSVLKNLGLSNKKEHSIIIQGSIDLYNNYCTKYKCNNCEVGKRLFIGV